MAATDPPLDRWRESVGHCSGYAARQGGAYERPLMAGTFSREEPSQLAPALLEALGAPQHARGPRGDLTRLVRSASRRVSRVRLQTGAMTKWHSLRGYEATTQAKGARALEGGSGTDA